MRFLKTIVLLVILLNTALIPPGEAAENSALTSGNAASANSIYLSETSDAKKVSLYSGSGFFITPNVVVTSNHIIKDASKIEIIYDDIKITALVIGHDESSDLALLMAAGLENRVSPLTLANSNNMRQGNRVYALGFPLPKIMGMQPKLSEGLISSTTGLQGDIRMYQISTPVQPGNSGGPLLNDQAEVVGVITGSLNAVNMMKLGIAVQNVNYAVKINNLCSLINNCNLAVSLSEPASNIRLSAEDVADIAKKAVVFIVVTKQCSF